jgi:cytochrome c-type biogenesis protein CcmF
LDNVLINPNPKAASSSNELVLQMTVTSKEGLKYEAKPGILLEGMTLNQELDTVKAQNLVLSFNKVVDQKKGILEIGVKESASLTNLITLKVYEFPFINILWLGIIVMTIGFMMSAYARLKKLKSK